MVPAYIYWHLYNYIALRFADVAEIIKTIASFSPVATYNAMRPRTLEAQTLRNFETLADSLVKSDIAKVPSVKQSPTYLEILCIKIAPEITSKVSIFRRFGRDTILRSLWPFTEPSKTTLSEIKSTMTEMMTLEDEMKTSLLIFRYYRVSFQFHRNT